jgi:hypothetical protein
MTQLGRALRRNSVRAPPGWRGAKRLRRTDPANGVLERFDWRPILPWAKARSSRSSLSGTANARRTAVLLRIPVVEPAFQTLLIAAVGRPVLPAPGFGGERRAAIAFSALAMCTNPEHRLAFRAAANALPENHFSLNRHPPTQADFDSGNGSCQGRTSLDGDLLHEGCRARTPLVEAAGFCTAFQATIQVFAGMFWR